MATSSRPRRSSRRSVSSRQSSNSICNVALPVGVVPKPLQILRGPLAEAAPDFLETERGPDPPRFSHCSLGFCFTAKFCEHPCLDDACGIEAAIAPCCGRCLGQCLLESTSASKRE